MIFVFCAVGLSCPTSRHTANAGQHRPVKHPAWGTLAAPSGPAASVGETVLPNARGEGLPFWGLRARYLRAWVMLCAKHAQRTHTAYKKRSAPRTGSVRRSSRASQTRPHRAPEEEHEDRRFCRSDPGGFPLLSEPPAYYQTIWDTALTKRKNRFAGVSPHTGKAAYRDSIPL